MDVYTASLWRTIWWLNTGRVIEVPKESEAMEMLANLLTTPMKLGNWGRLVNQLEGALLDMVERKSPSRCARRLDRDPRWTAGYLELLMTTEMRTRVLAND